MRSRKSLVGIKDNRCLEPVAVELVQAALRPQMGSLAMTPQVWQQLTTQVARILIDDPTAHDRLQSFWNRLSQVP